MTDPHFPSIAIVGFGGVFPGGPDVASFWRNVAAGVDAGRDVPPGRWTLSPGKACRPGKLVPDKTYSTWGCYLDDGITAFKPDSTTETLDPVARLALFAAQKALQAISLDGIELQRAGVILGHIVLPTEATSSIARDVLLNEFETTLLRSVAKGTSRWHPRNRRIAALPAEIIAERFCFGGPAFTLDAACASSLYAMKLAVDELQSGRADVMLAGGLSRPDCQYTQIGFAQLQALSKQGRCAPLSAEADGLVVGEGAGFFVLKRLNDAIAAGDRIEAVIAGIGLSNDRGANLLAPHSEGQLRAMRAAYEQAGWSPEDVDYIECHATGTPTGDAVELASLHQLWSSRPSQPGQCVLGAVKSNVGHLLTGAGGAGLMKLIGMLRSRELWPIANLSEPAAALRDPVSPFRVLHQFESWPAHADRPRRAAINAFGFGGINAHVLIEEYQPACRFTYDRPSLPRHDFDEIVIVGIEATIGDCADLAAVRDRFSLPARPFFPKAGTRGQELCIDEIAIPLGEFRIPPVELPDLLPQQQLMLKVAARALDQAGIPRTLGDRAGVFLGVSLDPNTTNYHCRWVIAERTAEYTAQLGLELSDAELAAWAEQLQDAFGPPLTANRVMGNLAAITASRIAREFDVGGPSFTISADEDSGLRAVEVAVRSLQRGEIDLAIAGAVEFECDSRALLDHGEELPAHDGAIAFVLKRRSAAERDGNPILAAIDVTRRVPLDSGSSASGERGRAFQLSLDCLGCGLATAGATQLLCSAIELIDGIELTAQGPQLVLRDRSDGLRSLSVVTARGNSEMVLTEVPSMTRPIRALGVSRENVVSRDDLTGRLKLAHAGKLAFVFPGSGNAFPEMGRELLTAFPGVLVRQHAENAELQSQFRPDIFWNTDRNVCATENHKAMIFSQVALGTAICDLLAAFGIKPAASIGYSLGESAALFGLRIWRHRDEMLHRMRRSALFGSDLVSPFDAARKAWRIPADQSVPWLSGVINAPVEVVRDAIARHSRCDVLIVNTPRQCVIGGDSTQIQNIVESLQVPFTPLTSPSTVHCSILNEVRQDYLELHRMETFRPEDVSVYSSATGEPYEVTQDAAANAILAQATDTVDFTRVIRNAYRDGVRLFLEIGPGNSCMRMIDEVLADEPHWAGAACPATADPVGQFLELLGQLIANGVPVDLSPLGSPTVSDTRERIVTPVGPRKFGEIPSPARSGAGVRVCGSAGVEAKAENVAEVHFFSPLAPVAGESVRERGEASTGDESSSVAYLVRTHDAPAFSALAGMLAARAEAHAAFLHFAERSQALVARLVDESRARRERPDAEDRLLRARLNEEPPRALDYSQCLAFAIGQIGDVLGPKFAAIDEFPTRVRLPDEPLMLCHRILEIDGEPLSMSHGRLITEHDIVDDAWYLDCGRIPVCIAVEAGQADLFLSGWLGIDFETRGAAVYRLLDAVVTFHDALPGPGKTIRYDIRINQFFRQGDTWLFRFEFDATVDGKKLLTMRDGCAGFFSEAELAGGKGIVHTALDLAPRPGIRPDDWTDPVPMTVESFSDDQLAALRRGDFVSCFGLQFRGLPLASPVTIPDGMMRLVDRVLELNPTGGKYGLGTIRAEADIHPDDWFLTCHFCDDQVMPGTLMYECCLHTLRIYLLRMGWIGEAGEIAYEPIPEVRSRLKCRGQVLATTKKVWYEVTLKEIGYGSGLRAKGLGPENGDSGSALSPQPSALSPYCLADALMYADGKPIVEMTDMSVRLTGLTREQVERLWGSRDADESAQRKRVLFDVDRITEFAIGKPSRAFGDKYRVFDDERKIARLPGPPFQFLDRIVSIENCEQWKLAAGGAIVAEYDVPPDAWYFAANRQSTMPFAVLLETALQPCGWLAAYLGSALTSDVDLSFRNLGGKATQFRSVTSQAGTLATTVKITSVSQSAGMIIQHFAFDLRCRGEPVYQGTTYFGFFSHAALANQIGIRDANVYRPAAAGFAHAESFPVSHVAPFPSDDFRMIDRVTAYIPEGGPHGFGYLQGQIDVDPAFWFFKAHFYQDPVWPGSLGLESFLQLLKVYAAKRWGTGGPQSACEFSAVALNAPHEWVYRGQVIPLDKTVTVDVVITAVDDANRRAVASGFLTVDGRVIYQMIDFTVEVVKS